VGSGTGEEERGQVIGQDKPDSSNAGQQRAGNEEGEEVYETEITVEDILSYLMEDLELPNLDKKKVSELLVESNRKKSGYQKHGIHPRLAKKKTVIEKIKRKQGKKRALREIGQPPELGREPFKLEDLRYFRIKKTFKKECNAVIFCIMDVSGSMDNTKKYLARSFFFILAQFIRMKYTNVEVVFISHTTTANEVNENDFFHRVESGGTYISSGLRMVIDIIGKRYNPEYWNIYSFYVSDGDNWAEDNDRTIKASIEICELSNMFGYAEIMSTNYATIKNRLINNISSSKFIAVSIKQKQDLWNALKDMLKKEQAG
jgi:sporulation protein YhbH